MTTVVNRKNSRYDEYIGRPGPFGNPFRIGDDGDRSEVLEKYRVYFYKIYKKLKNKEFRESILGLKDKVLGCWCAPERCHGDVIAEYLNKQ